MDQRGLHSDALLDADAVVRTVAASDLERPTPCEGWTLGDLLAHMLGQQDGFAAAVTDGDAPRSAYESVPFTQEAWRSSVERLLLAFAAADLDAEVIEIEFSPRPLPLRVLVGAQLLDAAVHAWDVARSLGRDYTPPDAVVAAVAEVARPIVDDERRATAGFFGPTVGGVSADLDSWSDVLAHLGRDADWAETD